MGEPKIVGRHCKNGAVLSGVNTQQSTMTNSHVTEMNKENSAPAIKIPSPEEVKARFNRLWMIYGDDSSVENT